MGASKISLCFLLTILVAGVSCDICTTSTDSDGIFTDTLVCPDSISWDDLDKTYCCGEENWQYCCDKDSYDTINAVTGLALAVIIGIIVGVISLVVMIIVCIVICVCCCIKASSSQPRTTTVVQQPAQYGQPAVYGQAPAQYGLAPAQYGQGQVQVQSPPYSNAPPPSYPVTGKGATYAV